MNSNQYIQLAQRLDEPEYANLPDDATRVEILNTPVKVGNIPNTYFNRRRLSSVIGAPPTAKITLILNTMSDPANCVAQPEFGLDSPEEMAEVYKQANAMLNDNAVESPGINFADPQTGAMIDLLVGMNRLPIEIATVLKTIHEVWRSPAEGLAGRPVDENDLKKARLIRQSADAFSNSNTEYRQAVQAIIDHDGSEPWPAAYGA